MRLSRCCSTSKAMFLGVMMMGGQRERSCSLVHVAFFCVPPSALSWLAALAKGIGFSRQRRILSTILYLCGDFFPTNEIGFRYGFLQSFFKTTQKVSVCLFVPTYVTMYLYIILFLIAIQSCMVDNY